jgi:hypothetical protein
MNKNIAKKWVKALRSGKYKQGQGYLKITDHEGDSCHCCLGVLCELYNEEQKRHKKKQMKVHEVRWEGVSAIRFGQGNTERGVTVLPKNVQDWAGLKTQEGSFNDNVYTYYEDLTVLNDGGNDFYRIADAIEDNVDKL